MSKNFNIDFSEYSEEDVSNSYWTPASQNYFGAHSYSEVRFATANFLGTGDVGDEDWRNARKLPFGDEALEALYPGSRGLSFIQYPWEHPDADTSIENPVNRMIENDPTFEWALKEMEKLNPDSEKYKQLAELVSEIRNYNTSQIEEEAFIHAPSWAIDSLIYAQENSYDPEVTKIIEEFGPRSSMAAKVISTTLYPNTQDIKRISSIFDEYEIKSEGFREHCFALVNGKKVFGPYGPKYGILKLFKDPNLSSGDTALFRKEQACKLLNEIGIVPVFDEDNNLTYINHDPVTPDNLLQAKDAYSKLATSINSANSTIALITSHIKGVQEDLYWDKLKLHLKKERIYDDVLAWSADINPQGKPFPCLSAIGHNGLDQLLDDYASLRSKIYTRINSNYYSLIVGKATQVGIVDSPDLAKDFKEGDSEDLIYYLLDTKSQKKLGTLSEVKRVYGYRSKEHKAWLKSAKKSLFGPSGKYTKDSVQQLIAKYNSNRRVKTIYSRTMREYGWILGELPFTRKEVTLLSDCLEAYGRAIVAAQQKVPVIKKVFGRLKSRVEKDIHDNSIPNHALDSIRKKGTVAFVYSVKTKPIPKKTELHSLMEAGLITKEEVNQGEYLDITVSYDYIFTKPSDVFRYVSNFAVTAATIKLAMSR